MKAGFSRSRLLFTPQMSKLLIQSPGMYDITLTNYSFFLLKERDFLYVDYLFIPQEAL